MKNSWCEHICRTPCRGTESTPTYRPLERRRTAGWRRVATSNRDIQSDVANERNWTATQRNQLSPELGAARGFQRLKISSPGWKMRGRGEGLGAGRSSAPGGSNTPFTCFIPSKPQSFRAPGGSGPASKDTSSCISPSHRPTLNKPSSSS